VDWGQAVGEEVQDQVGTREEGLGLVQKEVDLMN